MMTVNWCLRECWFPVPAGGCGDNLYEGAAGEGSLPRWPNPVRPLGEPQHPRGNLTPISELERLIPSPVEICIYRDLSTSPGCSSQLLLPSARITTPPPPLPFLYSVFTAVSYFTIKFYYHLCLGGVGPWAGCVGPTMPQG